VGILAALMLFIPRDHNQPPASGDGQSQPPAATPSASADQEPTLGTGTATTRGYGTVRPPEINGGGDPSGVVTNISWSSWGGPQATGTGNGWWVPPGVAIAGGVRQPANIVAYNLGTCNGKPTYQSVAWYFPGKGESFTPTRAQNICIGQ